MRLATKKWPNSCTKINTPKTTIVERIAVIKLSPSFMQQVLGKNYQLLKALQKPSALSMLSHFCTASGKALY
jgi:hypothetical protein